jgi:mono/diheme cytochrome c family protein
MTAPEVHAQQRRENAEPQEAPNPMPWFVIVLTALLLAFGIGYIARSPISAPAAWGDGRQAAELRGPAPAARGAAIDGAAVYASRCTACHQASGAGLPGTFPPLAGSEWATGDEATLAAIVLHGVEGELTVRGESFTGVMPAFKDQLQDAELAAVLTHIRTQWGNRASAVTADAVTAVRKETAGRATPFQGGAELSLLQ